MKGLIAPLLVTMMTGMVFCQQPQSNSFASGSDTTSTDQALLGKYLLVMDPDLVRGLKSQGYLQSVIEISDRATIDHIIFHGSDRNSRNPNLRPIDIQQTASSDEDRRLEFMLTDDLIRMMRRDGLRYIIPQQEIGKYDEVVVIYKRAQAANTPANNNLNNGLGIGSTNNQRDRDIGQRNQSNNSFANRIRTGDDEVGNTREPFIGPRLPTLQEQSAREIADSRRTFTPRIGSTANDSVSDLDTNSRRIRNDRFDLDDSRFDRINRDRQNGNNATVGSQGSFQRRDLAPRSTSFAETVRQNNDLPMRRFGESEDQLQRDSARDLEIARLEKLRLENEELKRRLTDEQVIRDRRERQLDDANLARLRAEKEILRRDGDDLEYTYGNSYRRRPIENPTNRYPNRYEQDYGDQLVASETGKDVYVGTGAMPARNSNLQPTSRPPKLAINGPQNENNANSSESGSANTPVDSRLLADAERAKRNTQVLWFIMLCSVGLNFYLALIARSFYVRYEELADELRDTFTSTSM